MKKGLDFVLLFVVFVGVGGEDFTLTTAVVRIGTTPKPTTIARRIHVDPNVEESIHAPLDLFRLRASEIRRTRTDPISHIWDWDYWCQLQPQLGNCSNRITRYYYDAQIEQCRTFTYTGCNENKNNFDNSIDCETNCKGVAGLVISDPPDSASVCSLQPDTGICMYMFNMYYYNVTEGKCKSFIYGGCGGNLNRFSSLHECINKCYPDLELTIEEAT